MANDTYTYHLENLEETPPAPQEQDTITAMVGQIVVQGRALLRQQLERKAQQHPLLYDRGRIDPVMHEFEAASADIQATIVGRVRSKITTYVQQEVLRVLEDAINDAAEVLEDPVWRHNRATGAQAFDKEVPPPV